MRAVDLRHRRPDAVAGGAGSPVTAEIVSGVTQPPPRRPRKRSATRSVTLADVAAAAGVSAQTVSRVVRAPCRSRRDAGPVHDCRRLRNPEAGDAVAQGADDDPAPRPSGASTPRRIRRVRPTGRPRPG
ncbi:LacI family DNA-binding transcriptional regulator [Streptomyces olivaceus]|uniref:LacI family DNA-binding transcriptional regulator n=1 Tax=Streptomyces olivaceus TaxID=47716 RepID=UPI003558E0B6